MELGEGGKRDAPLPGRLGGIILLVCYNWQIGALELTFTVWYAVT